MPKQLLYKELHHIVSLCGIVAQPVLRYRHRQGKRELKEINRVSHFLHGFERLNVRLGDVHRDQFDVCRATRQRRRNL